MKNEDRWWGVEPGREGEERREMREGGKKQEEEGGKVWGGRRQGRAVRAVCVRQACTFTQHTVSRQGRHATAWHADAACLRQGLCTGHSHCAGRSPSPSLPSLQPSLLPLQTCHKGMVIHQFPVCLTAAFSPVPPSPALSTYTMPMSATISTICRHGIGEEAQGR